MSLLAGMNEEQARIAEETEGVLAVDAGPGTGKTFTIMNRYINIVSKEGVEPQDVLLLTFTHNAAEEMRERIINELHRRGMGDIDLNAVRAQTFDSFCLNVLTRDTSRIHHHLGIGERLSRRVGMAGNEAMERRYFKEFYERFLDRHGEAHGDTAQLLWDSAEELRSVIGRLLTLGICPTAEGWFRGGERMLRGDAERMWERAREMNSGEKPPLFSKVTERKDHQPGSTQGWEGPQVGEEELRQAIEHDRSELFRFLHHVFLEYLRRSIADNRLTFQMVAFFAFLSLYKDRGVREAESYRYVMIDEFQDTNELQFLISLLIMSEGNLCVVGDWKQGIYGFRYADIENLMEFEQRLAEMMDSLGGRLSFSVEDVKKCSLKVNYRSADRIIKLSEKALLLPANKEERKEFDPSYLSSKLVRLRSAKEHIADEDCRVRFLKAEDAKAETDLVLRCVQDLVSEGTVWDEDDNGRPRERPMSYADVAVLSRKRSTLHMLERRARELGVPLRMDGDLDIFRGPEGKTALAWLRLMVDPADDRAIAAIMDLEGHPHDSIEAAAKGQAPLPQGIREQRERLLRRQRNPNELLTAVYQRYGMDNDISQAVISQLSGVHEGSLAGASEMVSLIEENIRAGDSYPADMMSCRDAVRVQTMHGAKGLEYPAVIIAGMNEGDMPPGGRDGGTLRFDRLHGLRCVHMLERSDGALARHRDWRATLVMALSPRSYDEERRLLYVASSRSMQHLLLTCHRPSLFIEGLSDHGPDEARSPPPDSLISLEEEMPGQRPELGELAMLRRSVPVHQLLRPRLDEGGLGTEHGSRVHADAERLVHGMDPWEEHEGLSMVREVLASAAGARVTAEMDCLLPVGDYSLEGRIDLLIEREDSVEVHDWKTDAGRHNHDEYVIQLSVYGQAAAVLGKRVRCFVHYLTLNESVDFEPLPLEDIESLARTRLDRTIDY